MLPAGAWRHDGVGLLPRAGAGRAPVSIGIRNYAIVTAAYWAFTITDGALRLLVLLHFHELGYTPVQLAFLFLSTNVSASSPT